MQNKSYDQLATNLAVSNGSLDHKKNLEDETGSNINIDQSSIQNENCKTIGNVFRIMELFNAQSENKLKYDFKKSAM